MLKIKTLFLKYKIVAFVPLAFLVGWYLHYYYYSYIKDRSRDIVQIRENSPANKFINPIILVADNRKIEFDEYKDLANKVKNYIDNSKGDEIENTSFYFRDLNSGEWVGVNEDATYAPSSMLKVVTLVAYLKLADVDPKILLEKVYYEPKDLMGQNYRPNQLKAGYYEVKKLLQQMMIESDNDATHSLNSLHIEGVLQIYKDLELPDLLSEQQDFMSPKHYSRLFRALYNGSYVSRFYSNQALELLAHTKFDRGIVQGTGSTVVSHKFGELTDISTAGSDNKELHDCGIVYYPFKPYFICVMTKGHNFLDLEKTIADISKISFDYVENKK